MFPVLLPSVQQWILTLWELKLSHFHSVWQSLYLRMNLKREHEHACCFVSFVRLNPILSTRFRSFENHVIGPDFRSRDRLGTSLLQTNFLINLAAHECCTMPYKLLVRDISLTLSLMRNFRCHFISLSHSMHCFKWYYLIICIIFLSVVSNLSLTIQNVLLTF